MARKKSLSHDVAEIHRALCRVTAVCCYTTGASYRQGHHITRVYRMRPLITRTRGVVKASTIHTWVREDIHPTCVCGCGCHTHKNTHYCTAAPSQPHTYYQCHPRDSDHAAGRYEGGMPRLIGLSTTASSGAASRSQFIYLGVGRGWIYPQLHS